MKKSLSYRLSALAISYDVLLLSYEAGDNLIFVSALDIYYGDDEVHQKFLELMDEAIVHADDVNDADALRKFKEWCDSTKAVYDEVRDNRGDREAFTFGLEMTYQCLAVYPLFVDFLAKFVVKLQEKGK